MQTLIALALMAQTIGIPGYTLVTDDGMQLVTDTGHYQLLLGYGCDGMNVSQNVSVVVGSGGVAYIDSPDTLCDVFIAAPVSNVPCTTDDAGTCDINYEP